MSNAKQSSVGEDVGNFVGAPVGLDVVGLDVGPDVVELDVGLDVGTWDGESVGLDVVGTWDGESVGLDVVGLVVGLKMGDRLGSGDSSAFVKPHTSLIFSTNSKQP